jgi:hypothetical protein
MNPILANQDEEVWVEQMSIRDRKYRDDSMANVMKDESAGTLGQQFMDLITPRSTTMGE